ncbi:MAG: hypothetical protein HYZ50_07060 [Deltaproteobacteria bacterium]|nr:hypothetical protein [Deltaproteobacteria bacterium]
MSKFTADWIVESSFQETLRSLMAMADPGVLAGMSPERMTEALIEELRFISPYSDEEQAAAEEYLHQRGKEGHEVITHIAKQLQKLGPEEMRLVTEHIAQVAGAIPPAADPEVFAFSIAARMVSHPDVTDVVGCLASLMEDLNREQKETIARIVSHLVPFNYAPGVIHELTEKVRQGQVGLVEDKVSTHTLAEIIMAGYDRKSAQYRRPLDPDDPRGRTELDYQEEPDEGPGGRIVVLRAAKNLLIDLLAQQGKAVTSLKQSRQTGANGSDEADLLRDIDAYATELRGTLKALSTIHKGRTVYCVLQLPESKYQREFRIEVLREVARHVPELLFIDLVRPSPGREREFELKGYMKHVLAHVIPL